MKRIAFFVEGMTESVFLIHFLEEILSRHRFDVEVIDRFSTTLPSLIAKKGGHEFFFLIVDCEGDEPVKTAINDNYSELEKNGYSLIIGLRDLYPIDHSMLSHVEAHLPSYLPRGSVPVEMCLAVMEVETWFIAEYSHFQRIDPLLTPFYIASSSTCDPTIDDPELIPEPAKSLDEIYSLAGKRYLKPVKGKLRKTRNRVLRTVKSLDFNNLYLNVSNKAPHLKAFIEKIEQDI